MDWSGPVYEKRSLQDTLDTLQGEVSKIGERMNDILRAENDNSVVLKYKIEREKALAFNQTADCQAAGLKAIPKLREQTMIFGHDIGASVEYPRKFPATVFEFISLKNKPRELLDLLKFYETRVFFVGEKSQVMEVDSDGVALKQSADCLRELSREIGLRYKDWF
ncbi:hypothetical protein TWF281_002252 [Arthrobotrys megalospora]